VCQGKCKFCTLGSGTKLFLVLYTLLFISVVLTCYIFVCVCMRACMCVCARESLTPPVQLGNVYSIFVCQVTILLHIIYAITIILLVLVYNC